MRTLALALGGWLFASAALAQSAVPQTDVSRLARSMDDICTDCTATRFTGCGRFLEGPTFDRAATCGWSASSPARSKR